MQSWIKNLKVDCWWTVGNKKEGNGQGWKDASDSKGKDEGFDWQVTWLCRCIDDANVLWNQSKCWKVFCAINWKMNFYI